MVVLSLILAAGALTYMRSTEIWQRALALLSGLGLSWAAATVYLAHYWDGRQERGMPRPGEWSKTVQWMTDDGVGLVALLLAPALLGLVRIFVKSIKTLRAA